MTATLLRAAVADSTADLERRLADAWAFYYERLNTCEELREALAEAERDVDAAYARGCELYEELEGVRGE
jgi:hypothetical protein